MKRSLYMSATFLTILVMLGAGRRMYEKGTSAQGRGEVRVPNFKVDPLWPRPLPNHWVLGSVTGVAVDGQDHIWIVHQGADSLHNNEKGGILKPPTGCCVPAPQVLEFDSTGNLVSHWGGPGEGYDWPQFTGGITIDHQGNVWIAAAGRPVPVASGAASSAPPRPQDAHLLKFSRKGQFLLQIGQAGKVEGSDSKAGLNRPAGMKVEPTANEVYVADGFGNRRIVVFDAGAGGYKRHWGAYGRVPLTRNSAPTIRMLRRRNNFAP